MADFAAVLRKTIDALKENTPEMRAKVYQKARATIDAKLAAVSPPPPQQLVDRQKGLLEDAIANVEAEYAAPAAGLDDELEDIFAEFDASAQTPVPDAVAEEDEARGEEAVEVEEVEEVEEEPAPEATPVTGVAAVEPEETEVPTGEVSYEAVDEDAYEPRAEAPFAASGDERLHTPEWLESGAEDGPVEGPEPRDEEVDLPGDRPRRGAGRIAILLLLLVALGGIGYGAWLYRDDAARLAGFQSFGDMIAGNGEATPTQEPAEPVQAARTSEEASGAEEAPQAPADAEQPRKFTQRLMPDGQEVDEGPAEGQPTLGEGASVAEATQPGSTPTPDSGAAGQPDQPEASLPVGQKAIFYEERTRESQGSADSGSVVWSIVQESPGDNLPAEPAIRGEASIPEKGLQLKITIRRNADQSLPASHIMELIFLTPDGFQGGGINNVLQVAMKRSEQDTGSPLLGVPAKIADGFFLVALSDSRADIETNTLLLRRQSWIDIPIVYTSGRRALITMEKGVPGQQIFNEALEAWEKASSG